MSEKCFNVGKQRFAVVNDQKKPGMMIVLGNYPDRPAFTKTVRAGSGGNIWQRLPKGRLTNDVNTHVNLKNRLCLRSRSERDLFIKNYNNVATRSLSGNSPELDHVV
ncbi:MAG: hypothetical protein HQ509_00615 [Candidatus Marinimicrobia bacterium]|nr:hypothetical protein [Candidatus Neomarinimicrobiota bacterium]